MPGNISGLAVSPVRDFLAAFLKIKIPNIQTGLVLEGDVMGGFVGTVVYHRAQTFAELVD